MVTRKQRTLPVFYRHQQRTVKTHGGRGVTVFEFCIKCHRRGVYGSPHTLTYLLTYLFTYLLIPWSIVLLEKLTDSVASQEIPRIL